MDNLPTELLAHILTKASVSARAVCRAWRDLISPTTDARAYCDSFLVAHTPSATRALRARPLGRVKWYAANPGRCYAFDGSYQSVSVRRCLARTRKGHLCERRVSVAPYLCSTHVRLVPGLEDLLRRSR